MSLSYEQYSSHSQAQPCTEAGPVTVLWGTSVVHLGRNHIDATPALRIGFFGQWLLELGRIMKQERYVIYYCGQVQGVGFRYAVCRLSERFEITGFVRNLPDGRVQVIAEGKTEQLERFLGAIRAEMTGYIDSQQLDRQEWRGEFADFSLRW